ncbi:MAG: hypothetical protein ABI232_10940 [Jatrophihabitantaceae bacterium]
MSIWTDALDSAARIGPYFVLQSEPEGSGWRPLSDRANESTLLRDKVEPTRRAMAGNLAPEAVEIRVAASIDFFRGGRPLGFSAVHREFHLSSQVIWGNVASALRGATAIIAASTLGIAEHGSSERVRQIVDHLLSIGSFGRNETVAGP